MSNVAIKVEGLGKKYLLRHQAGGGRRYVALRDVLAGKFKGLLNRKSETGNRKSLEEFWALKDISFEVREGEAVGIIGRNGAGKSTLLKLLSRITEPSRGRIELDGRVASLLEVGTGFHPELTGRENVFLNGAVLGMHRAEIKKKFDEIVAFAEVEKFLDTPVKHYSSGMYMRLAFAVAAHLEPEILIVDEVLAVGDAEFQKKCLGKMEDVSKGGRTVLFVSHNMGAISRLCSRAVLLRQGSVEADGTPADVIARYLSSVYESGATREWPLNDAAPGNEIVRLRAVRILVNDQPAMEAIKITDPVDVEITYEVLAPGQVLVPNFHFYNQEGVCIFITHDWESGWHRRPRPKGVYASRVRIPGNFLSEGAVVAGVAITTYNPFRVHFYEHEAILFHIRENFEAWTARGDYAGPIPGAVRPILAWKTELVRGDSTSA
jgi:lipopolysaccharide transport system ATP-binding protein